MPKTDIIYEKKEVALSRVYPFAETKKAKVKGVVKEVSVVTVQELTLSDDETLVKNESAYAEIAMACGITIEEARKLARADAHLINQVQQGFLYDSEEIELID